MTDRKAIEFENGMAETADTEAWSELTFTCPKCGSHRLLKCVSDESGLADEAQVIEIHYKSKELEDSDEDDVEDAEVLVQLRPDLIGTWHLGVDDGPFLYFWFRCGECDYGLAFEDGSQVGDDMELAQWLMRCDKKSPSNG
ncbi:MAG: hypothetical protein FJY85_05205 [Deltaproteobacteria bacterium]|nr:hypothetical protein [Deltaproteobacteria bacterium]